MTRMLRRLGLRGWLCCLAIGAAAQSPAAAPAPPVARPAPTPRALPDATVPTPLDALTTHGRREFIRQMQWRDDVLVGFGTAPLIRELDRAQLAALLRWLDLSDYLPALEKQLVGRPLRLPAPSMPVARAMASLRQAADEERRRRLAATAAVTDIGAPAILRRYAAAFGARMDGQELSAQPAGDLVVLFDAAALALEENPGGTVLDDLLRVHAALRSRGVDTGRTFDGTVMQALLASRRFEQARAFAASRPHLADLPVPSVEDRLGPGFQGRSVFAYDTARATLVRQALPAPSGLQLVMVVGAGCHNSDKALAALHDDAALQARLRGVNLVLVTPPTAAVDTRLLTGWNSANPGLPIRVPYSMREWRAVNPTGVPAFFLLRDGKPVGQRLGWPDNGKALLGELLDEAAR